jgi:uncharacterized protein YdaT
MPWSEDYYPMKNLPPLLRAKAIEIAPGRQTLSD